MALEIRRVVTGHDANAKAIVASPYLQGLKHLFTGGRGLDRLRKHFGKKVVP